MNQQAKAVVDSIKPLFEVCLKVADRVGNDQIQIATGRAREIIKLLKDLENEIKTTPKNSMFEYLDGIAKERGMLNEF